MKNAIRAIILLSTLFIIPSYGAQQKFPTYFSIRAQGTNTARHLSGMFHVMYPYDTTCPWGTVSLAMEYTRSYDEKDIVQCLFGSCAHKGGSGITISGRDVADRNATSDWLADHFYLPTDYKSSITFDAHIENVIADFGWHVGLDAWRPGMYIDIHAPIVRSKWRLEPCETITDKGVKDHAQGYFTPRSLSRNKLLDSFSAYLNGNAPSNVDDVFANALTFPVTVPASGTSSNVNYTTRFQSLRHAKINCNHRTETRAADIRASFGWDFCRTNRSSWGLKIVIATPTGNRPDGEYVFEPIVGNGHHWELGIGGRAHWRGYCSQNGNIKAQFHLDGYITHLFNAQQTRTFDLTDRPFSRYMLAQRLGPLITFPAESTGNAATRGSNRLNKLKGGGVTAANQFRQEFTPVANLTTVKVDVTAAIQTELTAAATLSCNNWHWDIGYNLWFRSCEKLKRHCLGPLDTNERKWALKGDAHVFGYLRDPSVDEPPPDGSAITIIPNTPIALSATQNRATIHQGTNAGSPINEGIDNQQLATEGDPNAQILNREPNTNEQTNTSIQAVFLKAEDIALCAATTSGLSSKLFSHISKTWCECGDLMPTLGVGAEAEFAHNNVAACKCPRCGISQWGVWIKGSLSF